MRVDKERITEPKRRMTWGQHSLLELVRLYLSLVFCLESANGYREGKAKMNLLSFLFLINLQAKEFLVCNPSELLQMSYRPLEIGF